MPMVQAVWRTLFHERLAVYQVAQKATKIVVVRRSSLPSAKLKDGPSGRCAYCLHQVEPIKGQLILGSHTRFEVFVAGATVERAAVFREAFQLPARSTVTPEPGTATLEPVDH